MKRRLLTVAVTLICAGAMGCSGSPARGRTAEGDAGAPPGADEAAAGAVTPSDALPAYAPVPRLKGKIACIGEPTTTNVVARVASDFRRVYPNVTLEIAACLPREGPAALLEGRADLVPMSRSLSPDEVQSFTKKYGYPPTEIAVAADALAIFVEKKNPLRGLTLEQVDGIFSRTQRRGGGSIETWGQLGLTGEWAHRPIKLFGYAPEDGARWVFRQQALSGGEFRASLRAEGGGSAIVQGVAANPAAIGYASIFFDCKGVQVVPVAGADGRFYAPTTENIRSHQYPLSRPLYVYINKPPRRPFGGPAAEFLRFLL
jgi:phosphate transport system substrate-binding protein